jgi:HAD superfamily hydrolase (TIGR01509 family)
MLPLTESHAHAHPITLQALFFDAYGVLYHRPDDVPCITRLLTAHGLPLVTSAEVRARCRSVRARAFTGQASAEEYLQATLTAYGLTSPALREEGHRLLLESMADIILYEDVVTTLHQLKLRGLKLGVITDTAHPTGDKLRWLTSAGLDIAWDAFVSSCEVGVRKPEPRIYHIALEQAGARASEAAFVGHSPAELAGAAAIGLTTIAHNWNDGAQADFYLANFRALLALVKSRANVGQ